MHLILSKPPQTASSDLRATLKWTSLTERKTAQDGSGTPMCQQTLGNIRDVFVSNETAECQMTRGFQKLHLFLVNTEPRKKSFAFKGSQEWNSLPENIRNVHSTTVFRKCVGRWLHAGTVILMSTNTLTLACTIFIHKFIVFYCMFFFLFVVAL